MVVQVTLVAGYFFVSTISTELRLSLVVKFNIVEASWRMTAGTLCPELFFVEVDVAALATSIHPLELPLFVALIAGQWGMFPD